MEPDDPGEIPIPDSSYGEAVLQSAALATPTRLAKRAIDYPREGSARVARNLLASFFGFFEVDPEVKALNRHSTR